MNLVNLLHRIRSISSACFILILSRIELTDGSISTRSFSFRDMVKGLRRTSLEVLKLCKPEKIAEEAYKHTLIQPLAYCVALRPGNA